ncbi:winged helix-turn-helix domain-containing protein [Nonomuraea sp. NPDC050404]|uniref:ArsR/SmtB family transcription factor n=1 Tax=Nonomuraea sp. NPDC050404 TaxID=3155783 RepID=UPI0033E92A3F
MTQGKDWISDPKEMRALAHPARLAMLNRLAGGGSVTATEVAEVAGITPSAASYHLRILAKYGYVEDAPPRGDGRERLWKIANKSVGFGLGPDDQPDVRDAKIRLTAVFRRDANEEAERALANLDREPQEWRDASWFARYRLRVDAEEMLRLNQEIEKLLKPYAARHRDESSAPEDARIVEAQVNLFPLAERVAPGLPTEDHDANTTA